MKINGKDIAEFGAVQLKVNIQPPQIGPEFEIVEKAITPLEYEKDTPLGELTLMIYFRDRSRGELFRTMSAFMAQFKKSCEIEEIKGYKGTYKGYLTESSYEETLKNEKKILSLTFSGYWKDDEKEEIFDGVTSGKIYADGSREMPCRIEVTAKGALSNYTVAINGNEIKITTLAAGKTIVIDEGTATVDGRNAFGEVDLWEFPRIHPGENEARFSTAQAKVTVIYAPMWL